MKTAFAVMLLLAGPAPAQDKPDIGTKMPTRQELRQPSSCALWENAKVAASGSPVLPGQVYMLTLSKTTAGYVAQMPLSIEKGAVYSLAADGAAQVDLVQGNEIAGSVINSDTDVCGNGTAFTLSPGAYTIRIRQAAKPAFKLLVIEK